MLLYEAIIIMRGTNNNKIEYSSLQTRTYHVKEINPSYSYTKPATESDLVRAHSAHIW